MAGFISREDCGRVVLALAEALDQIPDDAAALRMKLKVARREYGAACKMWDRAEEEYPIGEDGEEGDPGAEIRALGSIEPGETIMLARAQRVRRTSENGVALFSEGREAWTNYSGKTTPLVVLRNVEAQD